ncbi:MAG: hypothetical protein WD011_06635 [Nitriliruptoraceae bacterium]
MTEPMHAVPDEAPDGTWVAPGGWRRVLAGFTVGTLAGFLTGLLLPRRDGRVDEVTGE